MRQSTGIERDTELVLAARNGDPWARDRLVTVHLPLVHSVVALAMNGRHGTPHTPHIAHAQQAECAEHFEHVVRETMLRALDGLAALPDPEAFRPWLVAIAVDGIRRHRHAQPADYAYGDTAAPTAELSYATGHSYEITEAARWLDADDSELLALWSLECTGDLTRYETAAVLGWSVEDMAVRVDAVRARLDAARVVAGALAGNPPCPSLSGQAAGWDGRPSAPWRDHLAHHTLACAQCAPRWNGLVPAEILLATPSPVPSPEAAEAARGRMTPSPVPTYIPDPHGTPGLFVPTATATAPDLTEGDDTAALSEPYILTGSPEHAAHSHTSRQATPIRSTAPGRHGSRAALRRRRQSQERGRRRAVIAAGVVVMAVTGGAFSLQGGRGGDDENLEANRLTAPGLDLPLAHDTSAHSGSPLATQTSPTTSPSASKSAASRPSTSASPSARTTAPSTRPARTAAPVKTRTTPPRPTTPAPGSQSTSPGSGTNTGTNTGTDTDAGSGTGAGPQNDQGSSSAADQVVALVNAERAKAGCGPLTANTTLTRAGQGHSDDMAARDFFDHTNPDGDGPGERVTAAGYPWSTYGENIAMGQSTPEQVMDAWMNSPGHRANILNCSFKEIGVGIHSEGGPYWTQVFGAR